MKTDFTPFFSHSTSLPQDEVFSFDKLGACPRQEIARLTKFEILYIKSGHVTLSVDLRRYTLEDNTICCLSPGQHRMLEFRGPVSGFQISISQQLLLVENLSGYRRCERVIQSNPELDDLVRLMGQENVKGEQKSGEVLLSLMKLFMICLKRADPCANEPTTKPAAESEIVQKFFAMLQSNFATKKLVADYADGLCITPNYLNAVVKRQTGFPASHHIQQYIITEAKRQAVYLRLRMKEVANRLGFDDSAHFSKFFKNYSGMNFSTFKRNFA
jgi:AraC-like DNA-binding protein